MSRAYGGALMRLAEALLRVPDAQTAIALTADQLGRADFDAAGDGMMARLSASAIALSKKFLPDAATDARQAEASPSLLSRLGARSVVAATVRAVQLLGRQFVLGQTISDAMREAADSRKKMAPTLHASQASLPPEGSALAWGGPMRRTASNLRFSYDMLGEGARTDADALAYLASYTNAIKSIAANARIDWSAEQNDGISIKLSALHPRYEDAQHARVMAELVPRVWGLCELAARANISLTIDAEEVDRLELSLDVFEALAERVAQQHPQWRGFGLAMQAYQTRALDLIDHVIALARRHRLRLMCRLVKGAYWDSEIKRAQELGLPHYPVFTHKHHTDVAYLACAQALLAAPDAIYPQFAGHNAGTIAAILQMAAARGGEPPPSSTGLRTGPPSAGGRGNEDLAGPNSSLALSSHDALAPASRDLLPRPYGESVGLRGIPSAQGAQFELQRLHGMGEGIFREVMQNPHIACRVYAPVGAHRDLLAYLVRRLLENGANSSFVHQLADESVGMDVLLNSPLHFTPTAPFPLPAALYGPARRNSSGLDLTVPSQRAPLFDAYQSVAVPHVPLFDVKTATEVIKTGVNSYKQYSDTPVAQRAAMLRSAADSLQQQMPTFCALLVKEAFKTWGDAVSEVREAIDFLRYYANEAERIMQPIALPQVWPALVSLTTPSVRPEPGEGPALASGSGVPGSGWGVTGETNELRLTARGVWVCISPWNFPLAIFIGQVAAALATGNAVVAKPAEQTPGVAWEAVKLLHAAGVPEGVLQLAHGPGETVGAALVAAPGVAGVVFTGSTQVAKLINRALAAKEGPIAALIAETGGINAMLVDSSALPEQVTDAVVQSAFRSAGQRCSALRVLCVHEAIADAVIAMINGAMQELQVGDPSELATDIGPLIDQPAFENVEQHVQRLDSRSKPLLAQSRRAQTALKSIANAAPPRAFEIASLAEVKDEIFGPVLQIVRWGSGALATPQAVVAQINLLGYGLTFGIQTRIDSRAQALAAAAHIGNVYINRNTIGAVVGVQPFGGEGLSGTGPKAGGPHYLYRFCAEQTVTINTTAAGGNAALLAAS
ncbi:MAG: L-glutamate gamma-semialdehyde dehydrogenase [Polaromonas sp.]|nr:L-glutamate gamma-semialdehyde dehydrogenase [Polaromonas sp.]